jgi:protein gp37
LGQLNLKGIRWVIVGGESGPGARAMESSWVISIRNQCRHSHVPFFFKQWGGVQKSKNGRQLNGKTFDEFPSRAAEIATPTLAWRRTILERFSDEINSQLRCA